MPLSQRISIPTKNIIKEHGVERTTLERRDSSDFIDPADLLHPRFQKPAKLTLKGSNFEQSSQKTNIKDKMKEISERRKFANTELKNYIHALGRN